MSFSRSYLLSGLSAAFGVVVVLFLSGGYLLPKDRMREGKLIAPIPLGEANPILPEETFKKQVLGARTIEKYPPSKYFPQSYEPLYGELSKTPTPGDSLPDAPSVSGTGRKTPNQNKFGSGRAPGVSARAYLVYDKTLGQILYAKNHTQELPIASLVKIMTAVVVLENAALDTRFIVPEGAMVGEAFIGLSVGESVRVEDLLYGILLNSGNDAAETLAYGVGGGIREIGGIRGIGGIDNRERFILAANEKAQELGMYDTYFVNPTGLDEETIEKSSFSTALDLLALTNYAMENEVFREMVRTKHKTIAYEKDKHKAFFLTNKLNLEKAHPAIKGVKPGTTELAGNTLVSYGELDGQEYIIIMLNSPHIRDETVQIYKLLYGK